MEQLNTSFNYDTEYENFLGVTPAKVLAGLKKLPVTGAPLSENISFQGIDVIFKNPFVQATEPVSHDLENRKWKAGFGHAGIGAKVCRTHGDLNARNILVTEYIPSGELTTESELSRRVLQAWLIDFARTGEGHALRDFIVLESWIKFKLLLTELRRQNWTLSQTLRQWYTLETTLIKQRAFSSLKNFEVPNRQDTGLPFDKANYSPPFIRAFETICILRRLAHDFYAPNANWNENQFNSYDLGLFYYAFNQVRYAAWETASEYDIWSATLAYLSAAMLAQKLIEDPYP